jgi:hypothetical protein
MRSPNGSRFTDRFAASRRPGMGVSWSFLCFMLAACGGGGDEPVPPRIRTGETVLSLSPNTVPVGTNSRLYWHSTDNVTSCSATGDNWSGPRATSGYEDVGPSSAGSYDYTLRCVAFADAPFPYNVKVTLIVTAPPATSGSLVWDTGNWNEHDWN